MGIDLSRKHTLAAICLLLATALLTTACQSTSIHQRLLVVDKNTVRISDEKSDLEITQQLIRKCQDQDLQSCKALGWATFFTSPTLSLSALGTVCLTENDDNNACTMAGSIANTLKQYDQALLLGKKACDLKDANGCLTAANAAGHLGSEDEYQKLLQKHCTLSQDTQFCKDGLKQLETYRQKGSDLIKRCALDDASACVMAGYYLSNFSNDEAMLNEATQYLSKACELNDSRGCLLLGEHLCDPMESNGQQSKENNEKSFRADSRACELGNNIGCYNVATKYYLGLGVSRDAEKSRAFFRQSCNLGFDTACDYYVQLFYR